MKGTRTARKPARKLGAVPNHEAAAGPHGAALTPPPYGVAMVDSAPARNDTALPDDLKAGVERLSGIALDDVRVHSNSDRPGRLLAAAYAQGTEIHIAPGQERHLPHEAWHVVQQKQGRVRPQARLGGVAINQDTRLEREAGEMGRAAREAGPSRPAPFTSVPPQGAAGHPSGPAVAQLEIGDTIAGVAKALGIGGATLTAIAAYFGLPDMVVYGVLLAGAGAIGLIISQLQALQPQPQITTGGGAKKKKKQASTGKGTAAPTPKKEPARLPPAQPPQTATESEEEGDDDDIMRLAAIKGMTRSAAKPKTVTAVPYVPPTPAQEWATVQRNWGNQCDEVISRLNPASRAPNKYGDHVVDEDDVKDLLPDIPEGHNYWQGRPSSENNEIRVFVEVDANDRIPPRPEVAYAKGISHAGSRRRRNYWVYQRIGTRSFDHFGGQVHEKDIT